MVSIDENCVVTNYRYSFVIPEWVWRPKATDVLSILKMNYLIT